METPSSQTDSNLSKQDEAYVLTLLLRFSQKDPEKPLSCKLVRSIKSEGKLKKEIPPPPRSQDQTICVKISDVHGKELETQYLKNPLIKHYEFANEAGVFTHKEVKLEEEIASVRFTYSPSMKTLAVYTANAETLILIDQFDIPVK